MMGHGHCVGRSWPSNHEPITKKEEAPMATFRQFARTAVALGLTALASLVHPTIIAGHVALAILVWPKEPDCGIVYAVIAIAVCFESRNRR